MEHIHKLTIKSATATIAAPFVVVSGRVGFRRQFFRWELLANEVTMGLLTCVVVESTASSGVFQWSA